MSFSYDAKPEICKIEPEQACCEKAECYGLLLYAKSFSPISVPLVTEHPMVAHWAAQPAAQITGAIVEVRTAVSYCRSNYVLIVQEESQRRQALSAFGHSEKEISLRVNLANLENERCKAAFLRGVFLSYGTVIDPNKDYHLELVLPYMNLAKGVIALLREGMDFHPALVNRKGAFVVYIKGSDRVADLLAYLGAGGVAMELMQVCMLKEVHNNVNRKTNFETTNIDKTVDAPVRQVEAIEKIRDTIGFEVLPGELRETAELWLKDPELSLRELGQLFQTPVSRSGVNHRLRRLMEEAENLKRFPTVRAFSL